MCHCDLSHVWVTESPSAEMPVTAPSAHGNFQVTHTCVKVGDSEVIVTWDSDEYCSVQSQWQADISLCWSDEAQFCLLWCHLSLHDKSTLWQSSYLGIALFGSVRPGNPLLLCPCCRAFHQAKAPGRSEPCLLPGPLPNPDVIRTSHCDHPSHPTQWGWCPPLF